MIVEFILRQGGTLLIACVVVAVLLGAVNGVTGEKIEAIDREKSRQAMELVVAEPDKVRFTEKLDITPAMTAAAETVGGTVESVFGVLEKGRTIGYAVRVAVPDVCGNLEMMVGVNMAGAVTGVSIIRGENGYVLPEEFVGKTADDLRTGGAWNAVSGMAADGGRMVTGVNAALAVAGAMTGKGGI